jgi:ABC-type sugar transport system substrate-binding protein
VGFDGLTDEVAAIGTEAATLAQHPAKIGSLGIATLYNTVLGKKVPKNVETGTSLITAANAKSRHLWTLRARLWQSLVERSATKATLAAHRAIYDALVARDADMRRRRELSGQRRRVLYRH